MSYVTNVIFSFSVIEEYYETDDDDIYYIMEMINTWLTERGYGAFGRDVDHVSGGNKHLEPPVYAAAFNYFGLDEFIEMLCQLPWADAQYVQVFVQEQDEYTFRLIAPCAPDAVVQTRTEQAFREAWQQMDAAHRQRNLAWLKDIAEDERGL